jgi:hypothetical protein
LWQTCSEASVVWVQGREVFDSRRFREENRVASDQIRRRLHDSDEVSVGVVGLDEVVSDVSGDAVRDYEALKWEIANGRARARSRRYFVANQLRYMWVLTFRPPGVHDRAEAMAMVSEFARSLRSGLVGERFPYWYSPELHPGGHGWHVNLFVPMRLDHGAMRDTWGHGHVWVTDFAREPRGPRGEALGLCRTPTEGWRRAARYGCKYAQKDWSPEQIGPGNHRYEIG